MTAPLQRGAFWPHAHETQKEKPYKIAKRVQGIVQLRLPSGEFAEGKSNKRCWSEDPCAGAGAALAPTGSRGIPWERVPSGDFAEGESDEEC